MNAAFLYETKYIQPELLNTFQDYTFSPKPLPRSVILLRWGNLQGSDQNAEIVLNRKQSLKNCFDTEKALQILKINRIRRPRLVNPKPDSAYPLIGKWVEAATGQQREEIVVSFAEAQRSKAAFFLECVNTIKKYNVYFFDTNIFFMSKKTPVKTHIQKNSDHQWEYEEIPADLDHDSRKVGVLAQRASYILGLDFGMVHAAIDARGRALILDVTPVPSFPPKALQLFRQHVDHFVRRHLESTPEKEILLGADPEFMLRDSRSGNLVFPSEFLNKEGMLGYDERSEHREGRLFPIAEIRPDPDYCPIKLAEKIEQILNQAAYRLPPYLEWLGGSLPFERYQIGGHIHFSSIDINNRLIRALDNYLAIPVMLIENSETSSKRRMHYGWLGSIRTKPHGGFEYRTPGSWLVSPELTKSCLCLAKIVVTEYKSLTRDYFSDPELQHAFYQGKKYLFYDIFDEIWSDLTATQTYQRYAQPLAPLTEMICSRTHWDEQTDLRMSWHIQQQN